MLGPALRQPDLAGAAENLTDRRALAREGESLEFFAVRIEAIDGVAAPFRDPRPVALVDIRRIEGALFRFGAASMALSLQGSADHAAFASMAWSLTVRCPRRCIRRLSDPR